MEDRALSIKPKPNTPIQYQRPEASHYANKVDMGQVIGDISTPTERDLYSVDNSGRRLPGVKVARIYAQISGINTKVVSYGKTKDKAWCLVRAWRGPESAPTIQTEVPVIVNFDEILPQLTFDAIANGIFAPTNGQRDNKGRMVMRKVYPEFDIDQETGIPVFRDKWVQFQLIRNRINKIKFIEREVYGKAQRDAILQLTEAEFATKNGNKPSEKPKEPQIKPTGNSVGTEQRGREPKTEVQPAGDTQEREWVATVTEIRNVLIAANGGSTALAAAQFEQIAKELGFDYKKSTDIKSQEEADKFLNHILHLEEDDALVFDDEDQQETLSDNQNDNDE